MFTSFFQEYSDGSMDSSEDAGGQTCHQCRRNDRDIVIWCLRCDKRGYCDSCISTWLGFDHFRCKDFCFNFYYLVFMLQYLRYSDIPSEEIQRICPACRGTCNCKVCLRSDNSIKVFHYIIKFQWSCEICTPRFAGCDSLISSLLSFLSFR